jgi:hypothetical protein
MMRTRAYENGLFIVFAHPKDALIINPRGTIVRRFDGDPVCVADVDLDTSRADSIWKYRRPHLYGELAAAQAGAYPYEEMEKRLPSSPENVPPRARERRNSRAAAQGRRSRAKSKG